MPTTEQPTKIFSLLGVSNGLTHTRAVKVILKELIFSKEILEPCCGNGVFAENL